MRFQELGLPKLLHNVLTQRAPLYVQYYITARCNLRCQQCNVIYANADKYELGTDESFKVIDNLSSLGTSVVLLTGGEPFIRRDLPKLAGRLIQKDVHPRIQTNGLASRESLNECTEVGVRDISISLDSLHSNIQDEINGGFENSWATALKTISNVSQIFDSKSFGALGCVFSPSNFREVPNIIKFASEIGWWVSLVPAHSTDELEPRSFSSFDKRIKFPKSLFTEAIDILDKVLEMKKTGFNVYDSDQYLQDMKNFVTGIPITWRNRNDGNCDAGTYYFAVLPDGSIAPCCDWRMDRNVNVGDESFPATYRQGNLSTQLQEISKSCSGCMYGSYPEISISARFARASLERFNIFSKSNNVEMKNLTFDQLSQISKKISMSL